MKHLIFLCLLSCAIHTEVDDPTEEPTERNTQKESPKDLSEKLLAATDPGSEEYPEYLLRYGDSLLAEAQSKLAQAHSLKEKLSTNPPDKAALLEKQTRLTTEAQQLREKALTCYQKIVADYPNYPRRDEALYISAFTLQDLSQDEDAKKAATLLVSEYPSSRYAPGAWLLLAEEAFQKRNKPEEALQLYLQVMRFPESPEYVYAHYMAAWCYYNLTRLEEATLTMGKVITLAKDPKKAPMTQFLRQEAKRDVARFYSSFGAPNKAKALFLTFAAPKEVKDMLQWLALNYDSIGLTQSRLALCAAYPEDFQDRPDLCAPSL